MTSYADELIYADDPDAHVDFEIRSRTGGINDWASPTVRATRDDGTVVELAAQWQGTPGSVRMLRVPVAALERGRYRLRLVVPGGNDANLDAIQLH